MDRCVELQTQMLDFVYDVLDEELVLELNRHLEECARCQSALRQAREQQQLLAAAARMEFPLVRFEQPQKTVPAREEVATPHVRPVLPLTPRSHPVRRSTWRVWGSVAAALLVLLGPSFLAGDYLSARRKLDHLETARADLLKEREHLETQFVQLEAERNKQDAWKEKQKRAQDLQVVVSGPRTLQSGVVSDYYIRTRDGNGQEIPSSLLTARILDRESGQVLFESKNLEAQPLHRLQVPADLPLGPNAQPQLEVVASTRQGVERRLREDFELAAPQYLAHVTTDKPLYQPGEVVRYRGLVLERFNLTPVPEVLDFRCSLTTPTGEVNLPLAGPPSTEALNKERTFEKKTLQATPAKQLTGLVAGEWRLPETSPRGEYTLQLTDNLGRMPTQTRRFVVQPVEPTRLDKRVTFSRRSYGPGEEVIAQAITRTLTGLPVANLPVQGTLVVDGQPVSPPLRRQTNAQGVVRLPFRLPQTIERGVAGLTLLFEGPEGTETVIRTVPLALPRLHIRYFPEGGQLVSSGANRIYFQVRTPDGRPAELNGRLVDDLGDEVARVQTFHDDHEPGANHGVGLFLLTPHRGRTYRLVVDEPRGVEVLGTLDTTQFSDVALTVPTPITTAHEPIQVRVRSFNQDRLLWVAAYCRGRLFDHQPVRAPVGEDVTVTLRPAQGIGGVYRITVFEEDPSLAQEQRLIPRAERLIFRRERDRLNLEVAASKQIYTTGEPVKLQLEARDENQQLTAATALVSVVNRGLLSLADDGTHPSMPTHFFLTSELREGAELERADFLLTNHPKAEQALDLLLGTQGWRRFVERDSDKAEIRVRDELALLSPQVPGREAQLDQGKQAAQAAGMPNGEEEFRAISRNDLQQRQAELDEKLRALRIDGSFLAAREKVERAEATVRGIRALFPVAGLFLLIGAMILLGRGLSRPMQESAPLFSSAIACLGLFALMGLVANQEPTDDHRVEARLGHLSEQADAPGSLEEDASPAAGALKEGVANNVVSPEHELLPTPTAPSDTPISPAPKDASQDGTGLSFRKAMNSRPGEARSTSIPAMAPAMAPAPTPAPSKPSERGPDAFSQGLPKSSPPSSPVPPPTGGSGRGEMGLNFGGGFGGFSGGLGGGFAGLGGGSGGSPGSTSMPLPPATGGIPLSRGGLDPASGNWPGQRFGGGIDGNLSGESQTYSPSSRPVPTGPALPVEPAKKEMADHRSLRLENDTRVRTWELRQRLSSSAGVEATTELELKPGSLARTLSDHNSVERFFYREYAYQLQRSKSQDRSLAAPDVLFWDPARVLLNGQSQLLFDLGPQPSSYQVTVFGHTLDGKLGAKTLQIESRPVPQASPRR